MCVVTPSRPTGNLLVTLSRLGGRQGARYHRSYERSSTPPLNTGVSFTELTDPRSAFNDDRSIDRAEVRTLRRVLDERRGESEGCSLATPRDRRPRRRPWTKRHDRYFTNNELLDRNFTLVGEGSTCFFFFFNDHGESEVCRDGGEVEGDRGVIVTRSRYRRDRNARRTFRPTDWHWRARGVATHARTVNTWGCWTPSAGTVACCANIFGISFARRLPGWKDRASCPRPETFETLLEIIRGSADAMTSPDW